MCIPYLLALKKTEPRRHLNETPPAQPLPCRRLRGIPLAAASIPVRPMTHAFEKGDSNRCRKKHKQADSEGLVTYTVLSTQLLMTIVSYESSARHTAVICPCRR